MERRIVKVADINSGVVSTKSRYYFVPNSNMKIEVGDIVYTKFLDTACTKATIGKVKKVDIDIETLTEGQIRKMKPILAVFHENKIRDWLKDTYKKLTPTMLMIRPRLRCYDGFEISVQASNGHYCKPRENLKDCNYVELELGFPSYVDKTILPYAEDKGNPTKTIYPFVPVDVVNKMILTHGGLETDLKSNNKYKNNMNIYSNYYGIPLYEESEEN